MNEEELETMAKKVAKKVESTMGAMGAAAMAKKGAKKALLTYFSQTLRVTGGNRQRLLPREKEAASVAERKYHTLSQDEKDAFAHQFVMLRHKHERGRWLQQFLTVDKETQTATFAEQMSPQHREFAEENRNGNRKETEKMPPQCHQHAMKSMSSIWI